MISTNVCIFSQYLDVQRYDEALLAWRNATLLKHDHVSAWVNSIILLDNLGESSCNTIICNCSSQKIRRIFILYQYWKYQAFQLIFGLRSVHSVGCPALGSLPSLALEQNPYPLAKNGFKMWPEYQTTNTLRSVAEVFAWIPKNWNLEFLSKSKLNVAFCLWTMTRLVHS